MKTLIAYGTKYGCTEKCAKNLSEKLTEKADLCNLKTVKDIDLSQYNKVIIGGSIYMGQIQKEVSEFCSNNLSILKDKNVGLFICCMRDGDIAQTELNDSFPNELIASSIVKESFGGEFIFKKMSFMHRLIVKMVSKENQDTSNIINENINRFAQLMNNA